jgi:hypothetical protein
MSRKWMAFFMVASVPLGLLMLYFAAYSYWMCVNPVYSNANWIKQFYIYFGTVVLLVLSDIGIGFYLFLSRKKSARPGTDGQ